VPEEFGGAMATVAEVLLETLILNDVERIYGLPGDSLNGF
jgi:pyruvate dehydrogenase (quinone)